MPIYEYRCTSCGHELEKLQRMSDAPLTDCPACETSNLRRLISPAGFRLKGSGWYETDFKTGSRRNVAGEEAADKSKTSGKDAGKDDGAAKETKDTSTADATKQASPKKDSGKTSTGVTRAAKDKSTA